MAAITWPWNRKKLTDAWNWPIHYILNCYGWWAEEASTPFLRTFLWWLRFFLLISVFFNFWAMLIAVFIKFSQGDIMVNLFSVFAAGPGVVGTYKIIDIVWHREILKSGFDIIDVMLDETEEEFEYIVRSGLRRSWIMFTICLTFDIGITAHWLFRPVAVAIFSGERTLIVDTWPVFTDTWVQWFFTYLFQGVNVCLCGHTFYAYDIIYFCVAENLLSQMDVLKARLTSLTMDGSPRSQATIDKCIKHHNQILRACEKLRDATAGVILFQCINTVIMLCTGVFILLLMDGINMSILMNLGEISMYVILILFVYCWYSNEMTYQCANLVTSGYMVDWVGGTSVEKSKLHNLMTMSMQPMIFGGIVEIDLNTFINVLKTTFSYYNFLVAANEANKD